MRHGRDRPPSPSGMDWSVHPHHEAWMGSSTLTMRHGPVCPPSPINFRYFKENANLPRRDRRMERNGPRAIPRKTPSTPPSH